MAHYRYVVRKRGGSYVEGLSSVDKRSDAGNTFDSRKKRKTKLLASLLEQRSEVMRVLPIGDLWSLVMRHLIVNGDFCSLVMKDRFIIDDFRSLVMKDRIINGDFWSLFMECVTLVVNLFISKHGRVGRMK